MARLVISAYRTNEINRNIEMDRHVLCKCCRKTLNCLNFIHHSLLRTQILRRTVLVRDFYYLLLENAGF